MSFVYIESQPGLWTVGHYRPDGKWVPESDHTSPDGASCRVAALNGGCLSDPDDDEGDLSSPDLESRIEAQEQRIQALEADLERLKTTLDVISRQ